MQANRRPTLCVHGGHIWAGGAVGPLHGLIVEDHRISRLLEPSEVGGAMQAADETFDASGCLVTPPLFDGHVHSPSTLLRGTENSFPLELWSYYSINYGRGFNERCLRAAIMLTAAEMIRAGIGGYIDHFPQTRFAPLALAVHHQTGLRVGFAPFFADLFDENILDIPLDASRFVPLAPTSPEAIGGIFAGLQQSGMTGDRVHVLLGPNAPQRCSEQLWQLWRQLQSRLDLGSHTHLLETLPQASYAARRWPQGLVAEMDRQGLVHERLSVAHGVWLDDADRAILARRGAMVVHNPISNSMLGSGRFDARRALAGGVAVALGTDSTSGRHDLFETMRHMLVSGRTAGSDFRHWLTPHDVFRSATHGVRALGVGSRLGHLQAGAAADLLVIDFASAGLVGAPVSIEAVVAHADPRSVKALMVDGVWLLRDGRIEAFDEPRVYAEAADCAAELRMRAQDASSDLQALAGAFADWHETAFTDRLCSMCGQPHRLRQLNGEAMIGKSEP
jgi:cytosine/adenosine deaminase-related metal-dependent hydrolase